MQKVKGNSDKFPTLQHLVTNYDLFEFVLAGFGPAYLAFTRSLECVKMISRLMLYMVYYSMKNGN